MKRKRKLVLNERLVTGVHVLIAISKSNVIVHCVSKSEILELRMRTEGIEEGGLCLGVL